LTGFTIINKQEETGFSATEDKLSSFLVKGHNSGDTVVFNEFSYSINAYIAIEIISSFVELFEKTDSGSFNTVFGGEGRIDDVVELEVIKG